MLTLILQYDGHRGPDAIGQHKLTFSMDESIDAGEFNPMTVKKGTQYIAILIPAEEDTGLKQETIEEATRRFQSRMHALIGEIATLTGVSDTSVKESLKTKLKQMNIIKESTTELDIQGYAKVITILIERKNELTN
jgi:hypothetical protein